MARAPRLHDCEGTTGSRCKGRKAEPNGNATNHLPGWDILCCGCAGCGRGPKCVRLQGARCP
eukprot:8470470-Alexandrium_andersonii.AAC.1